MAIKEFFRKLSYEVKRRENPKEFSKEFYFLNEENADENSETAELSQNAEMNSQSIE